MSSRQGKGERGGAVVFVVLGLVALLAAVPFSIWLSRAPASLTQYERLATEIGCTCGTCPLRPIGTCGCGFADGMLANLRTEVEAGKTDAQIKAVFVAQYGDGTRIKPEASGLDLMAWLAPMALLMVGLVGMAAIIAHWRAAHVAAVAGEPGEAHPAGAPAAGAVAAGGSTTASTDAAPADRYRDIVERELGNLETE
jgi:cytochrome c-type biogenesis protein CcmH